MVPTIHDGDLLCVAPADAASLRRGDVVLMHPPNDPTREFVKRVIGLPNDIFEIDGAANPTSVLIKPSGQGSFQRLKEPYLPGPWTTENFCCQPDGTASAVANPIIVQSHEVFVLGDNRNFSSDSRNFGPVPTPLIVALVTADVNNAALYSAMPTLGG